MMWGWQRPRRPLGLRSRRYVRATTSKCGTRPLTKLGLRPLLHLRKQIAYTTFLPSVHQVLPAPRLTLPSRQQKLARTALPRPLSLSLLTALPRRPSNPGFLKKKQTQSSEWPLMPPSPQLLLRTHPKRKRYPPRWRLSWQLSLCLLRGTLRVRVKKPQRQHSPSPSGPQPKIKLQ